MGWLAAAIFALGLLYFMISRPKFGAAVLILVIFGGIDIPPGQKRAFREMVSQS